MLTTVPAYFFFRPGHLPVLSLTPRGVSPSFPSRHFHSRGFCQRLVCAGVFCGSQQPSGSSGLRYKVLTLAPRCGIDSFLSNMSVRLAVVFLLLSRMRLKLNQLVGLVSLALGRFPYSLEASLMVCACCLSSNWMLLSRLPPTFEDRRRLSRRQTPPVANEAVVDSVVNIIVLICFLHVLRFEHVSHRKWHARFAK